MPQLYFQPRSISGLPITLVIQPQPGPGSDPPSFLLLNHPGQLRPKSRTKSVSQDTRALCAFVLTQIGKNNELNMADKASS